MSAPQSSSVRAARAGAACSLLLVTLGAFPGLASPPRPAAPAAPWVPTSFAAREAVTSAAASARAEKLARLRSLRDRDRDPRRRIESNIQRMRQSASLQTPAPREPVTSAVPVLGCGTWTELSPNARPLGLTGPMMVYDPVRDRLVALGGVHLGYDLNGGVWALNRSGTPSWTLIATSGTTPEPTVAGTVIFDPSRDRMVMFSGYTTNGYNNADTWTLDFATNTWSQLSIANPPPPRIGATAIYDAPRDRMIVYGGFDGAGSEYDDVWSLSFSGSPSWTQLSPAGTHPLHRGDHTAIFDAPRNRMVVFGGYSSAADPSPLADAWALSLSGGETWTELIPSGTPPAPR